MLVRFPKDKQWEFYVSESLREQPNFPVSAQTAEERTLLYDGLPSDVSDREHGVEYVTEKKTQWCDLQWPHLCPSPPTGTVLLKEGHVHWR